MAQNASIGELRRQRGELRRQRGRAAEGLAAEYLEARGLAVLARNVRCGRGELDLVCRDGDVLVVVEVRQRCRSEFGGALASVTRHKQRKIICATRFLLRTSPQWRAHRLRFDVIGVQGLPGRAPELIWVKGAFRAA
jgi:putative endonuclease